MAQFELSARSLGLTAEDLSVRTLRAVIAEFIATFLFVFVGAGTVVSVTGILDLRGADFGAGLVAIALAHGLAIATLVAATAKISGGHINHAVTFAAVITGRMKAAVGVFYIAGQLLGAVIGAWLLKITIEEPVWMVSNL